METLIIGNLEVLVEPFEKKTLVDAISYCQSLKNNYRLQTKIELKSLL